MKNPLRAFWGVKRGETAGALAFSSCIFAIVGVFWILKPLKKSLFVEHYDAAGLELFSWHLRASQAELLAKVVNTLAAFFVMWLLSALSRRMAGARLVSTVALGLALVCALFAALLPTENGAIVWAFYVFGDVFNMLLVASFFAFLSDSMTADASRRLYGPVVLGGVLGGAVGSTALATAIDILPPAAWLAIATAGAIGIGVVARLAGAAAAQWRARANGPAPEAPPETTLEGSSALEGIRTVLGSRYLLSIAAIVCLYEIISTLADFQFTETVAHNLDGSQIRSHVSTVYFISNALSATVQLLAAGAILSRFGVRRALIVLPIALAAVSMSFLAMPILWIASALSVVDNGLNYSLHQSARESLYVVADRAAKYRAKAFVDVFLMRVAKMTAVGIVLALSTLLATFDEVRWLSLLVLAFVVLWLLSALAAGRRYDALAAERHVDKTV